MTVGVWVALILGAVATAFVLAPLVRRDAEAHERQDAARSELQDLQSQREMALGALRDLEDDRATGKIGDQDYAELKAKLSTRAVEILKELDRVSPGAGSAS